MKCLQGTWEGSVLDSERVQITGWVDASYTASSADHSNLPLGFNYLANQFLLQQNWLRFERAVVTSGTDDPSFGFRFDTILPGADYRFTTARGLFSGQLTSRDGEPAPYGIDPIQFYGEAYFPTVGRGLERRSAASSRPSASRPMTRRATHFSRTATISSTIRSRIPGFWPTSS